MKPTPRRSHFKRILTGSLLVAASLCHARAAAAQEWLSDRRYSEGIGLRVSEGLVLHPGIGAEAGYDSNVFYTEEDKIAAARMRITPHVDLSTLAPQRLEDGTGGVYRPTTEFRLGLAASYQEYFGPPEVETQRNLGLQGAFRLTLFPQGKWSFSLSDDFNRTNNPTAYLGIITGPTARDQNRVEASLKFAPGGGNLELQFGYGFFISYFEEEEFRPFGNYVQHDVFERIRWRWIPKTAILQEARISPTFYSSDLHPDATPIRTRIGINGLLTPRLSLLVLAGYGVSYYSTGDDFDSFIAQTELRYIIGPVSNLRIGYQRDFDEALISNYIIEDRGYLTYAHMFGGRFLVTLEGAVASLNFSPVIDGTGEGCGEAGDRKDLFFEAGIFGEYRIQDWIAVNVSARHQSDSTDFECAGFNSGYARQEVFGGVRAFY